MTTWRRPETSSPRAATSVATRTVALPARKAASAASRSGCVRSPWSVSILEEVLEADGGEELLFLLPLLLRPPPGPFPLLFAALSAAFLFSSSCFLSCALFWPPSL